MEDLQRLLFEFAKQADHLNQELRSIPITHVKRVDAIFELQDYLSVIARKAESVASIVGRIKE